MISLGVAHAALLEFLLLPHGHRSLAHAGHFATEVDHRYLRELRQVVPCGESLLDSAAERDDAGHHLLEQVLRQASYELSGLSRR